MFARAKSFFRDELGNSVVEYALILSLVALVAFFGLRVLGTSANTQLTDVSSSISITAAADPTGTTGAGGANNGSNGQKGGNNGSGNNGQNGGNNGQNGGNNGQNGGNNGQNGGNDGSNGSWKKGG